MAIFVGVAVGVCLAVGPWPWHERHGFRVVARLVGHVPAASIPFGGGRDQVRATRQPGISMTASITGM